MYFGVFPVSQPERKRNRSGVTGAMAELLEHSMDFVLLLYRKLIIVASGMNSMSGDRPREMGQQLTARACMPDVRCRWSLWNHTLLKWSLSVEDVTRS
jgi:hypothetical protein